jgi:DNA gyrase subunit A
MGIRLDRKERLVGLEIVRPGGELLVLSESGMAKRVPLDQFPLQGRAGKGVRAYKAGVGLIGAILGSGEDHAIAHLARVGARSLRFSAAPRRSRAAAGARLVEVKAKDRLSSLAGAIARPDFAAPIEEEPTGKRKKGKPSTKAKASTKARKPKSQTRKPHEEIRCKEAPAEGPPKRPAAKHPPKKPR